LFTIAKGGKLVPIKDASQVRGRQDREEVGESLEASMAAKEFNRVFVDGIQSIATHNGVHRVTFFHLVGDGRQNEATIELLIPSNSARAIGEALAKLGK
jgi:hypothetical protein